MMNFERLLQLSHDELDYLYAESDPGPLPDGEMEGIAIVATGTYVSHTIASLINYWAWRGKIFSAEHGTVVNQITALALSAIVADVYKGPSLFDQKECIVLDYSRRGIIARYLRDEIRMLEDGLYLGKAYGHTKPLIHFALQRRQI